jgi:hypothetical protein
VISGLLNLEPSEIWVAGSTQLRNGRVANRNAWRIDSRISDPDAQLDAHIENVLDLVEPRLEQLRIAVPTVDIGVNCVAYFDEFQGNGFHLSVQLIHRIAKCRLSVDFDLYGGVPVSG